MCKDIDNLINKYDYNHFIIFQTKCKLSLCVYELDEIELYDQIYTMFTERNYQFWYEFLYEHYGTLMLPPSVFKFIEPVIDEYLNAYSDRINELITKEPYPKF